MHDFRPNDSPHSNRPVSCAVADQDQRNARKEKPIMQLAQQGKGGLKDSHLDRARRVLQIEATAVRSLVERLDANFAEAVDTILAGPGRVIVCGMGKSGLIGNKIAATLASTGPPAFSLHPGEASHGDLGMVRPEDIFLALSNSGETEEVIRLIPFLQDNGNRLIAITGRPDSTLARYADFHLNAMVPKEACPLQLAPTASTTAALALGDALAIVLMEARGFLPEHFARLHPSGSLGRRLLTRVGHVMHTVDLPIVHPDEEASQVVQIISAGRMGVALVCRDRDLVGIITDGDLRRAMERHRREFSELRARDMMTANPICIDRDARLQDAVDLMTERSITSLVISEGGRLTGLVHLFDCTV
jgi:arabinose-5-phosphate isomerase